MCSDLLLQDIIIVTSFMNYPFSLPLPLSHSQESIRQKENTRFYLQQVDEFYCSSVAIFIGNLPSNLSQRGYENIVVNILGKRKL